MEESTASTNQSSFVTRALPVLLPVLAIAVVIFLGFRWYNLKTNSQITTPELTSKIEIENLDSDEQKQLQNMARGIGDYKTVKMLPVKANIGTAEIRYEFKDGKLYASLITSLATPQENETYQVWLKPVTASEWIISSELEENKAGYMTTFVLPENQLPVEVKVTHEGIAGQDPAQEVVLFQAKVSQS